VRQAAAKAIDFYKKAFGAAERMRMGDDQRIGRGAFPLGEPQGRQAPRWRP